MRFREAVRLARRNGACREAIEELRKMRDWGEFFSHRSADDWRAWWIRMGLPNPGQPGIWDIPDHMPTPEEEHSTAVRCAIAKRFPAERLERILSLEEEPSPAVRSEIAARIPAERIVHLPTPEEEPASTVRWVIAHRIPVERLELIPTKEEEPSLAVRGEIAARIGRGTVRGGSCPRPPTALVCQ